MNILVTGATGFLGFRVCQMFDKDKYNIIALGRNRKRGELIRKLGHSFYSCDLIDKKSMEDLFDNVDVVVHSGALSSNWGKQEDFYNTNVIGTQNVIDLSVQAKVKRFVYISSPSVYFKFRHHKNISEEEHISEPFPSFYTRSKYQAECLIDKAFKEQNLNTIILRPRAIFGPGDRALLPRLIRVAKNKGLPTIGNGNNMADLTYVDNVVESINCAIYAGESCFGQKYNITNGEPVKLWPFLKEIFEKMDISNSDRKISFPLAYFFAYFLEVSYRVLKLEKEPALTRYTVGLLAKTQTLDITKARRELSYCPKVTLDDGVKNTLLCQEFISNYG